jgi:hypothetical protein
LSSEELGKTRHGHEEIVLLFKCQIRAEIVCCGRFKEQKKVDWNIWKISGKKWD